MSHLNDMVQANIHNACCVIVEIFNIPRPQFTICNIPTTSFRNVVGNGGIRSLCYKEPLQ